MEASPPAGQPEPDYFRIGKALHCALLTPDLFARTYVAMPDLRDPATEKRGPGYYTKESRARRDAWLDEHGGAALGEEEVAQVRGMVASVLAHPSARPLVEGGLPELTMRWRDPASGVECKGRADFYDRSIGTVTDVKTTEDARPEAFAKSCANYGYHHQNAMYQHAFAVLEAPADDFAFVVVEKTPPYECMVHQLEDGPLAMAYDTVQRRLAAFSKCVATGVWPGLPTTIQRIELPRWQME
jgi:hypothetical protein